MHLLSLSGKTHYAKNAPGHKSHRAAVSTLPGLMRSSVAVVHVGKIHLYSSTQSIQCRIMHVLLLSFLRCPLDPTHEILFHAISERQVICWSVVVAFAVHILQHTGHILDPWLLLLTWFLVGSHRAKTFTTGSFLIWRSR